MSSLIRFLNIPLSEVRIGFPLEKTSANTKSAPPKLFFALTIAKNFFRLMRVTEAVTSQQLQGASI